MRSSSPFGLPTLILLIFTFSVACEERTFSPAPDVQQPTRTASLISEPVVDAQETAMLVTTPLATPPAVKSLELLDEDELRSIEPAEADPRAQQMVDFLNGEFDGGRFIGTVMVAQNGEILVNQGFGQADAQAGIPNLPETQFRIGSLTKQFTAAAVLKLQEQGLLNVQDPVAKYLPDYPRGNEITIHHLLTHTAGIPNYERRRDLPEVVQSPIALDDLIATFANQPLEFLPGQQYQYSSSGYVVLTKIIELVSGKAYADYLESQFFAPLNMASTGYDYLSPELPNPATGYHLTPGGPRPAILTDSSWPTGAGALYSTVGDLYRWDRALYGEEVLSMVSRQAFFTPYVDTRQGTHYGYGWDIGTTAGRPSIAHGGGIFGFASFMTRFPEDDAVIIVLSNGIQMPPRIIAEGLSQILFGGS
jgi:CubicO group peptidase (beta-lactamase class C family)